MNNNQFFDNMKSMMNPELFMSNMKNMPSMDFSSFTNALKQNAETFSTANQIASESMQSIVRRGAEVFQQNVSNMFNAVKNMASSSDLEQAAACQQDYLRNSVENSLSNTKEMMEMASKSTMEIFQVLGNTMSNNFNKAFEQHKQPGKGK